MNEIDIDILVRENTAKSAKLYLQRQELQMQLQTTQLMISQVEMQMVKLDGESELLERLRSNPATELPNKEVK